MAKTPTKPKTCGVKVCGKNMVRCTRQGIPTQNGAYWVCPAALVEFDPRQFSKPWKRRIHKTAEVVEGAPLKQKRAVEKRTQPALFEDKVLYAGTKKRGQFERRGQE